MFWIVAFGVYIVLASLFYWWIVRSATPQPEAPSREEWTLEHVEEERRAA